MGRYGHSYEESKGEDESIDDDASEVGWDSDDMIGNKIENKNSSVWKSVSKSSNYQERIVMVNGEDRVLLQRVGDDEEVDVEGKKMHFDEVRQITERYRDNGVTGGKNVLRLSTRDHGDISPPTILQINNRNAYMSRTNLKKNGIVNLIFFSCHKFSHSSS